MRLRVLDAGDRQVRAQRLHLRQPRRRADALRPRPVLADEGRRRRGRRPRRGRVGRRQGHDPGQRPRRQDRRDARQGRAARRRPVAGAAVPHVGDARDRDAGRPGRASPGFTGDVRGLRRRALPVVAGGRLRRARGRHRERGDLHRAGPVLGDRLPAADQVRARHLQAGPRDGGLPGHRRVPAPVPRARDAAKLPNGAPNPAYDDVEVNGTPDGRVREREAFIRDAYKGADATMRLAQSGCATAT